MHLLEIGRTGLLVIDVQEKLFPLIDRAEAIGHNIERIIRGFNELSRPIFYSEQYPKGLGRTVPSIRKLLDHDPLPEKSSFSCYGDRHVMVQLEESGVDQWVVVGIEAHVCVLQTVRELLQAHKQVAVVNDAVGSRSIFDYATALADMRDAGARIVSLEMVLFELLRDSSDAHFKAIQNLIK